MKVKLKNYISTIEISVENVVASTNLKREMHHNFALINKYGIALSLSYVVTKENAPYIEDGMQMALDYDAFFTYRFVEPIGEGTGIFDNFDAMEQYKWTLDTQRRVIDFILAHNSWNHKLAQSVIGVLLPGKTCGGFTNIIAVQPNGDLYPCINICNSNLCIGNLVADQKEIILKNIEERSKNIEIQKRFHIDYKEKCSDCFYKYFCNGICGAVQIDNLNLREKYEDYICKMKKTQIEFDMFFSDKNWGSEQYLCALRDYLLECMKTE